MTVALETFVKQLTDSGVIAPGKLDNFIPPKAHPQDAQELARQLVQSKQLTKFQAQEIYQGRAKSLILGNYTILDKIGAGGMGQVFKAQHRRMDRIVAIKMLPRNLMKDAATVARFEREVRAAAKLEHPNIVTAYDADEANGIHFLVMQCVEGSDLSAMVKKNGPLSVPKAVNYILQTAHGLEYAHKHGVIHRDIKPANLLLNSEGTVKILDMGLARLSSDGNAATQAELTGTGAVLGTVDYMAPEQALSTKHADARADIYSLGCTLHYLLTGKAAYDGDTLMAKLLAHREKPIPSLGPEVPEQVQAMFEKMVAKAVEDRYQAMSEVVIALDQCNSAQDTSLSVQQSVGTSSSSDVLTFLRNVTLNTIHKNKPIKKSAATEAGKNKKPFFLGAVGAGLLGLALLAGVLFKMRTKDGTLLVEVDQPDAVVQVLNDEGKVEITRPGEKGTISISVDPGKHRLKIEKDGFEFFAKDFEIESGGEKSIKATLEPVFENATLKDPAFKQWMKDVAALPAEQQVVAVAKKLQELNPGFDGKVENQIESGAVTEVRFVSENVSDVSPVRALTGLRKLECWGSTSSGVPRSVLSDLSPLVGMRLKWLDCTFTKVSDLKPLKGMPLVELHCGSTLVHDLSPLKGMRLNYLECWSTAELEDLSPLAGMPLTRLSVQHTKFSDLSPLKEMHLTFLEVFDTRVADLSPLTGMSSLQSLNVCETPVSNLSPLRGLAFKELTCDFKPERDTDLLRSIKTLVTINRKPAAEFWKEVEEQQKGKRLGFQMPGFDQWMKEVAAMPAEKQVEAVAKKLQELNPGFDGKVTPTVESGVVTGLLFWTDNVTDISPVRALQRLKEISCNGGSSQQRWGMLSDLSPLRGMSLATLRCITNPISDLSPLQGMRLATLQCSNSSVADLSPLNGMPLTELGFGHTSVSDLSPLKGMKLTTLYCDNTHVSGLSPLTGMPMTILLCNGTPVTDLSSLKGMNLTMLTFTPRNITNGIEAIRQMKSLNSVGTSWDAKNRFPPAEFWKKYDAGDFGKPNITLNDPAFKQWMNEVAALPAQQQVKAVAEKLKEVNPGFDGNVTHQIDNGVVTELKFVSDKVTDISPVRALLGLKWFADHSRFEGKCGLSDLSPLKGMQLTHLELGSGKVSDLSPLRGMPLVHLSFGYSPVSDMSPLRGMKLNHLQCESSQVSDLSSLKDMPLASLACNDTKVADLSPLRGMPLKVLICYKSLVSELSPLNGMPIAFLDCSFTGVSDLVPLKGMPLTKLCIHNTDVSDLSPLKGMELTTLFCSDTQVTDVSPLQGLPLVAIAITPKDIIKGMDVLRQMKSLTSIGVSWRESDRFTPDEFWNKYDTGVFGKPTPLVQPVTTFKGPAFKKWQKDIAALPAEEQVKAVVKKLQKLNPAFDGKVTGNDGKDTPKIEKGVVTEIGVVTDSVTDISPVRALTGLRCLNCSGSWPHKGTLSDLSPLNGLQLTTLSCSDTQVSDLSPLIGMPLTKLWCNSGKLSDLSPLKGLPLTNLSFYDSRVADLSPLKGMPLTELHCGVTPVTDLSPLSGMRLTILYCHFTNVTDLSPLKGMPLAFLQCNNTGVFDLSPLRGMNLGEVVLMPQNITKGIDVIRQMKSLTSIGLGSESKDRFPPEDFWKKYDAGEFGKPKSTNAAPAKPITTFNDPAFKKWEKDVAKLPAQEQVKAVVKKLQELNPGFDGKETHRVEGVVATEFNFVTDNVTDISPVRAFERLKGLTCGGSNFGRGKLSDLSPLRGMHLTFLNCGMTKVADLSPLSGLSLNTLKIHDTKVSDLSPLTGMPLNILIIYINSQIADLSPLKGLKLTHLNCGETSIADLSPLKGMPLTFVDCNHTQVIDLSPLHGMPLTELSCNGTSISDLSPVKECKSLRSLNVKNTKVSPVGIAALQGTLSNCKIDWDDPSKK